MTASSPPQSDVPIKDQLKRRRRPVESGVIVSLFIAGVISIGITIGILYELVRESLLFFQDDRVSFVEFFTTTVWQPQAGSFGIWPLILGTLLITVIALCVLLGMNFFEELNKHYSGYDLTPLLVYGWAVVLTAVLAAFVLQARSGRTGFALKANNDFRR